MPEPVNQARTSVSTTLIGGIGRVQRLPGGELVVELLVHGEMHGLRFGLSMARELEDALTVARESDPPAGRQAAARRANFAAPDDQAVPFTARRPVVAKPNGKIL
jgi:hypothetical protein